MKQLSKENLIEHKVAQLANEIQNAAGFQINIDTLTGIKARVTTQKFYEVTPSEFMPVEVGEDAWAMDRLTYSSFSTGEDFESGIIEQGSNDGRLTRSDTQITGVRVPRKVWGRTINYNLAELYTAQQSGNWSLVEAKEGSRYKSWQLGIQKTAFLGLSGGIKGLLSQTGVTSNLTVITKKISSMSATEFNTFLSTFLNAYFTNANNTVLPDTFVIPTDDYLGLPTMVDEGFPLTSRLERILAVCKAATGNESFKVKSLVYCQSTRNSLGVERYALYRSNDAESLTFEVPVDYTTTIQDTVNGFNYESVGYGQFSSVDAFRPAEMLYFDY